MLGEWILRLLAYLQPDILVAVVDEHDVVDVVIREGKVRHDSPELGVVLRNGQEVKDKERNGGSDHA